MSTQPPVTPSDPTATLQHLGLTLEAYADAKKLPIEFLKDCGLRTQGSTVRIPYFGIDGRESNAVRYRSALEGKNRFKWGYGSKPFLYGLDRLANTRTHGSIVIVETTRRERRRLTGMAPSMLRRLVLAGVAVLLVGAAAYAETPEPSQAGPASAEPRNLAKSVTVE